MAGSGARPVVGVLGLQGSFREHMSALERAGAEAREVRAPRDLEGLQGLVLPGGESTHMAHVCREAGLTEHLAAFARGGAQPVWGTCAGLIFLAEDCVGASAKTGGQSLLGGLDVCVHRNFFGSQVSGSFEAPLPSPSCLPGGGSDFRGLFIRAPAIVHAGAGVEVLSSMALPAERHATVDVGAARGGEKHVTEVVVAVRQGSLLGTSFHPELTEDTRWHEYFLGMVASGSGAGFALPAEAKAAAPVGLTPREELAWGERPADMPLFGADAPY